MRSLLLLFFGLFIVAAAGAKTPPIVGAAPVDLPVTATKIALVIGNDNYEDKVHFPTLKVCRNDADSMTNVLKSCGFTVITCKDANRKTTLENLDKFVSMLPNFDVSLVYYSGHGTEMDGRNYIIPVDLMNPKKTNEVVKLMFKNSAVDIQATILSEFSKRQDKVNFLIIDACRISLDDFAPGSKAPKTEAEVFSKPDQHIGTTVVFATGARQKSFESKGNNSVFTNELLKQIPTPNLSYRDVFMNAAEGTIDLVSQYPNDYAGLQQPQIIDMVYKNFFFVADNKKATPGEMHSLSMPDVVVKPVFSDGVPLMRYQKADLTYGFQDPQRKVVIPAKYEYADDEFHDGLAFVESGKKFGFIDKQGNMVIPCQYDRATSFSQGLAMVYKDGKYGYIDKTGAIAIEFIFSSASPFSEGLAVVKANEKYGYIDKEEKLVINYDYDEAGSFFDGRACVKVHGKYGYIDKEGKVIIPCQFDEFASFHKGFATVKMDDRILKINPKGETIKECYTTNRW